MKLFQSLILMLVVAVSSPAFATVLVNSPADGSSVPSNVQFNASSSTGCSGGVAAMGVYLDNSLIYVGLGASVNTALTLPAGRHLAVVQEWDFCGAATKAPLRLMVGNQAGVTVTSPLNNSTVSPNVSYLASAQTACPTGIASMGVYVNGSLAFQTQGSSLNTQISLSAGTQNTVVQAWDNCGGISNTPVVVNVASGNTLSNLQAVGNWNQWGELAPSYNICNAPCGGQVTWSMYQNVSAGSLSGNATQFNMGGTTPYSDVLWSNKLIGQGSTLNMRDPHRTLLPSVHHLIYDTDVYVGNLSVAQDLEFDINMYMSGVGMEWGTECNNLGGGVWDIWNNINAQWVHTSIPCNLNDQAWNHVHLDVQREANNDLTYNSITVNGVTSAINQTVAPFPVPNGWYGMTVNYQMDGNNNQAPYMTMLDNLNVTYW